MAERTGSMSRQLIDRNVYLTIDIDGLDPSIVPTTGTPEPGGLGWYETLTLIRKLAESKRVVGMDLVEYSYQESFDVPGLSLCKTGLQISGVYFQTVSRPIA